MDYINLASGASYFQSPAHATTTAIEALQAGASGHGTAEGNPDLRAAIADRYAASGADTAITPEQVMITPGGKQALYYLFQVLLQHPDQELVVPTPAWFGFHQLMQYCNGKLVQLPTTRATAYTLDEAALRATLTANSRILLLTNPVNPTGRVYTKQELETILAVAADYPNLYIISDEIYDFITYNSTFTSILSCQGATEKVVVVNGFSKSFAMSDWRIGYMVGPAELVKICTAFQAATLAGVSKFMQTAAAATFRYREEVIPPMLEVLQANRQLAEAKLKAIPQLPFFLPQGAYYFFPDFSYYLPCQTPSGETLTTSTDLCRYLKEEQKLELSPGDYFGAPGHARLSCAIEQARLATALDRLKTALAQLTLPKP